MSYKVISINRKQYACGLFWQPLSVGITPKVFANKLAKNSEKKYNLYTNFKMMIGLGNSSLGHRAGMPALAAMVLDKFSNYPSLLGVFKHENVFFLLVVRNGVILQDQVFDVETEARTEFAKFLEIPDWGALIAPASWAMPRAVEYYLIQAIPLKQKIFLKPINSVKSGLLSVFLMCLFFVVFIHFFKEPINKMLEPTKDIKQINPELAEEYHKKIIEKQEQVNAKYEVKNKELSVEPLVMPYDYLPDPVERANLCYKAIGFLSQPVLGWYVTNISCEEEYVVAELHRSYGTLETFYSSVNDTMYGVGVEEKNEDTLMLTAKLPLLRTYSSIDKNDTQSIIRKIISIFQALNMDVNISTVVDTLTNGVDKINLNVIEIDAQSKLLPINFIEIFSDFEGVYMTKCDWNSKKRIWNYEVIIYAK